jgi:hypothetical protein
LSNPVTGSLLSSKPEKLEDLLGKLKGNCSAQQDEPLDRVPDILLEDQGRE